jgi:hypothetical protein
VGVQRDADAIRAHTFNGTATRRRAEDACG